MPQTQRFSQSSNQIKPTSTLGSALGWSEVFNAHHAPESSTISASYNLTPSSQTQAEKDDFRQKLLEIRLNDIALKYCQEKNVSAIGINVVRIKTTATKKADGMFIPIWAEEALSDGKLQQTQLIMGDYRVSGLINVFVFSADETKMTASTAYQEQLNQELNNTPAIEKALKHELWRHTLLDRCRQKGLVISDLSSMDAIRIIQIHDAFITSGLLQELIEERETYFKNNDLNQIDDKFALYKNALRERIIKPDKSTPNDSELALMADCVQDLFNARADTEYMNSRIKTVILCRRGTLNLNKAADKNNQPNFDVFMKICSEHEIDGKEINFNLRQSKEDYISQSTIETIKRLDRSLFTPKDEEAIKAYFKYDKKDLQEVINDTKSSILKFYKNKEYLK